MYIFFSFLVRLSGSLDFLFLCKSEDAHVEEEGVEDDLRLLLFLDLYLLLVLLEIRPEREVCKVCCPISSCQTVRLQHWDQTYY